MHAQQWQIRGAAPQIYSGPIVSCKIEQRYKLNNKRTA